MKTINLSVVDDTYFRLSRYANDLDVPINHLCEDLLRNYRRPYTPLEKDEQYQPTDEEIEEALKSSKTLNPFFLRKELHLWRK